MFEITPRRSAFKIALSLLGPTCVSHLTLPEAAERRGGRDLVEYPEQNEVGVCYLNEASIAQFLSVSEKSFEYFENRRSQDRGPNVSKNPTVSDLFDRCRKFSLTAKFSLPLAAIDGSCREPP